MNVSTQGMSHRATAVHYADDCLQLCADVGDRVGPLRRHLQQRQPDCTTDAHYELVARLRAFGAMRLVVEFDSGAPTSIQC